MSNNFLDPKHKWWSVCTRNTTYAFLVKRIIKKEVFFHIHNLTHEIDFPLSFGKDKGGVIEFGSMITCKKLTEKEYIVEIGLR